MILIKHTEGPWAQLPVIRLQVLRVLSPSASVGPFAAVEQIPYTKCPHLFYFATSPISLPFPGVGWGSRMGLQPLGTAFVSSQRWWMPANFIPTGTRASDSTKMLPPPWGYQGIAGPGIIFPVILSGWESICASRRRGECVCFCTGLVPRTNFLLAQREKKKLGAFPLILEEYAWFLEMGATLGEQLLLSARRKPPEIL